MKARRPTIARIAVGVAALLTWLGLSFFDDAKPTPLRVLFATGALLVALDLLWDLERMIGRR